MLLEGKTDIIETIERGERAGETIEILNFYDGKALVLSHNAIALYKNKRLIDDALGNGLISLAEFPTGYTLANKQHPWVIEHTSGFVGLYNESVILILPAALKLFANKQDALHNRACLLTLPLS